MASPSANFLVTFWMETFHKVSISDIEALFQLVTGRVFDGNNNGTILDNGRASLASTQINLGPSGDVPFFASLTADPANSVMLAAALGGN